MIYEYQMVVASTKGSMRLVSTNSVVLNTELRAAAAADRTIPFRLELELFSTAYYGSTNPKAL
ncbi:hypothetical protein NECAME_14908 [Necator americanus]|uniref:Uncharacterized protein n=1 Tax=Necator americanus TaxID=51031 RepID=W2SKS3_NECAM|nr:hypothetical protein NECAME_14908 [Necator americanus]ETN70220.1 hypothetical protein NECAME_14908 [Necator americanus]